MSSSSSGILVIGMSLDKILELTSKKETFESYNIKGEKTGKTESEIVHKLINKINGKELKLEADDYDKDKPELYVDYILDFLLGENKIKDGSKFGIYELMPYYEKVNIKNYIIGFGYQEKTSLSFDQIIRLRTNFVKEIVKYTNYTPIEDDIKIHFNHYLD